MPTEYRSGPSGEEPGNSGPEDATVIDPSGIDDVAREPDAPPRKQRKPRSDIGKPRGSGDGAGSSKKTSKVPLDLGPIAEMLAGLTQIAAMRTGVEEIGVDQDEMKVITERAQAVARHYKVETTQKSLDFIALFGSIGGLVGTRVAAYNIRKHAEKEQRQQGPSNNGPMPLSIVPNV